VSSHGIRQSDIAHPAQEMSCETGARADEVSTNSFAGSARMRSGVSYWTMCVPSLEHDDPVTGFTASSKSGEVQPVVAAPGSAAGVRVRLRRLAAGAGGFAGIAVTIVGGVEGDQFEKLVDPIGDARLSAGLLRNDRDIRRDGEAGTEPSGLDDVADAPAPFITVDLGHVFPTEHCATIRSAR
jgi:hypothetical protein